ncbi:MAG: DUF4410 domain-containing protein [Terrimicrobiaceae bacterium]
MIFPSLACLLTFCSCSSVGIHSVQKKPVPLQQAPSRIDVERFSAPLSAFRLGQRSADQKRVLRDDIVTNLARSTAAQLRTHAANSSVVGSSDPISPGSWIIRGRILKVDQGSRALRAGVGLGLGRTEMRTSVAVFKVTQSGLVPLLKFKTTGNSGMEPGVALGVATGGVGTALSAASAAGSLVMSSLPGVSSDIDRTSYEIAAVLSVYLQTNGLLDRSRIPIQPNMRGRLPTTVNLNRAIPAPLRAQ